MYLLVYYYAKWKYLNLVKRSWTFFELVFFLKATLYSLSSLLRFLLIDLCVSVIYCWRLLFLQDFYILISITWCQLIKKLTYYCYLQSIYWIIQFSHRFSSKQNNFPVLVKSFLIQSKFICHYWMIFFSLIFEYLMSLNNF